jgi:type II secretory pathway component PulC
MINNQLFNLESILKFGLNIANKQRDRVIRYGYLLAGLWLSANAALVVNALRTTVSQPPATVQEHSASSYPSNGIMEPPIISEDVALLRDPFSDQPALNPDPAPKTASADTSGLLLQGIILSRKKGVVLQDPRNSAIYFLSEGEEIDGVRAKSITKSKVSVEANGKTMDFPISGVKK